MPLELGANSLVHIGDVTEQLMDNSESSLVFDQCGQSFSEGINDQAPSDSVPSQTLVASQSGLTQSGHKIGPILAMYGQLYWLIIGCQYWSN